MVRDRNAFTLMEIAAVLLLAGLVAATYTKFHKSRISSAECYTKTKAQLAEIRVAVENFSRTNDRLPMPAARNLGADDPLYGREAAVTDLTQASGISFGAVPFQVLGLANSYAGDCWGNKLTYAVTSALAAANGLSYATGGVITFARGLGEEDILNRDMAYAVFSHGQDGLGAVKLNEKNNSWCMNTPSLANNNCAAASTKIIDAPFNNGKDAGNSYFDDVVLIGGKPGMLSTTGPGEPQSGPPLTGTTNNTANDCAPKPTSWSDRVMVDSCANTPKGASCVPAFIPHTFNCSTPGQPLLNGSSAIVKDVNQLGSITATCQGGTVVYSNKVCNGGIRSGSGSQ